MTDISADIRANSASFSSQGRKTVPETLRLYAITLFFASLCLATCPVSVAFAASCLEWVPSRHLTSLSLSHPLHGDPMLPSIRLLRTIGIAEGTSFLILLLIAMPLKYWAHIPIAVQVTGSIHGFLFVALVMIASWTSWTNRWPLSTLGMVLVASLIPCGPFLIDRRLRIEEQKSRSRDPNMESMQDI